MTNDDRWFRMCLDAFKHLFEYDENGVGTVSLRPLGDGTYAPEPKEWTVDELMGMYSGLYLPMIGLHDGSGKVPLMLMLIDSRGYDMLGFHTWTERMIFWGDTPRDVWLQLVMWDRHGMTWDDKASRWTK